MQNEVTKNQKILSKFGINCKDTVLLIANDLLARRDECSLFTEESGGVQVAEMQTGAGG